jgi:hypothetical protein
MKSIKCSQCGLVNFADAFVCKRCNAQFPNPEGQSSFQNDFAGGFNHVDSNGRTANRVVSESLWENSGFRHIVYGLLWITGGSLLTYYSNSIFYGAIIFGVVDVFRGVAGLFTEID